MAFDSMVETINHMARVQKHLERVIGNLEQRSWDHDRSKLESPEKDFLDAQGDRLRHTTYGTDSYKELFRTPEAQAYVHHHYAVNDHHPQHFCEGLVAPEYDFCVDYQAISRMNLMQIVEMVCDWKAASERHDDGSWENSLEHNRDRFGISDQLMAIIRNTGEALGW